RGGAGGGVGKLLGGGAGRGDRRLRGALSLQGGEKRGVRLPRGGGGLSRRRLRRGSPQGLPGACQGAAHPPRVRAHYTCCALVPRAGLPRRRRRGAAFAPAGAVQLAPRLEGVSQANIGGGGENRPTPHPLIIRRWLER